MTARFATTPIGTGLAALDGGLTLTTLIDAANLARTARSDIALSTGTHGAEFVLWGDADLLAAIGVVKAGVDLDKMVGSDANGVGWRLDAGTVVYNNVAVASGLAVPDKGDIVGVRVLLDTDTIEFYNGTTLVHSRALPASGAPWYFAMSLGSAVAGELVAAVNSGQWRPAGPAAQAGWEAAPAAGIDLRLSDIDYLTAAGDTPAHARHEGIVDTSGIETYQQIHFWPWGGEPPAQGGNAQVQLLDADGLLDALAEDDIDGVAVDVRMGTLDGTLAGSDAVARFTTDHLEVIDDSRKTLHLRDAHDALDKPLSRVVFLPSLQALSWRPVPVVIGAVMSVPAIAATEDGSVAFLCDAPLASVSAAYDRGDPLEDADWSLDPSAQQLLLASAPLGPVTADVSSTGIGTPATLAQALADAFGRVGISAWQSDDADAIDTATGYAGIGYYAGAEETARVAINAMLPSYGAGWYQDSDGVIRLARVIDPDTADDGDLAFDLQASDLAADLGVVPDMAPNLSRRIGYQLNAYVYRAGELVTDLLDVTPARRVQLMSPFRLQAYSAVPMAARYRHADAAPPMLSCLFDAADAQAEIDRICSLYAVPRFFYRWAVRGDASIAPKPGDVGRITYPRYGLAAGMKVLVRDIQRNPATGDAILTLWGA